MEEVGVLLVENNGVGSLFQVGVRPHVICCQFDDQPTIVRNKKNSRPLPLAIATDSALWKTSLARRGVHNSNSESL